MSECQRRVRWIQVSFLECLISESPDQLVNFLTICSQGAALTAAAISGLSATVRNQVVGAVLFGYTKNQQNGGKIPNYSSDRLKVFCNPGDLVCFGTLTITPAHLAYGPDATNAAPQFLISKVTTA